MLEVLGAIDLILPAALGVAPILVPVAATGLALVMTGAVLMHVRRREFPALGPSGVLLIVAVVLAWSRFGPYAF